MVDQYVSPVHLSYLTIIKNICLLLELRNHKEVKKKEGTYLRVGSY